MCGGVLSSFIVHNKIITFCQITNIMTSEKPVMGKHQTSVTYPHLLTLFVLFCACTSVTLPENISILEMQDF